LGFLLKYLATNSLPYAALMGIALGLAYLTKSFAFVFTFVCILALIAFRFFWQRQPFARIAVSAGLVFICFAIVSGPYIAALSPQNALFASAAPANLTHVAFLAGTEKMPPHQTQTALSAPADARLKPPKKHLPNTPPIFSYKELPYGTYPDWFDTS